MPHASPVAGPGTAGTRAAPGRTAAAQPKHARFSMLYSTEAPGLPDRANGPHSRYLAQIDMGSSNSLTSAASLSEQAKRSKLILGLAHMMTPGRADTRRLPRHSMCRTPMLYRPASPGVEISQPSFTKLSISVRLSAMVSFACKLDPGTLC